MKSTEMDKINGVEINQRLGLDHLLLIISGQKECVCVILVCNNINVYRFISRILLDGDDTICRNRKENRREKKREEVYLHSDKTKNLISQKLFVGNSSFCRPTQMK
jgi:hypothetical protein